MLDFLEQNLTAILAAVIAVAGSLTSIAGTLKMFKSEKRIKLDTSKLRKDVEVTQAGIVEAFKTSKIGSEWKVSVSKQVDVKLEKWAEKFMIMFDEHEELRTQLAVANTKILSYTAAFNKLTDAEKAQINDLISQITDADKTIEV